MVPNDRQRTNFTVDNVLVVKKSIVTPLVHATDLVVHRGRATIDDATISTLTAGTLTTTDFTATNTNTTNLTATNVNATSILLPTTGGTPTSLNYYEEYSQNVDFKGSGPGPIAGTQTVLINIVRAGKLVTMNLAGFIAAGNGSVGFLTSASTPLPARFRPAANQVYMIRVLDGTINAAGELIFQSGGYFDIYRSIAGDFTEIPFSGIGDVGFDKFSLSWVVA